MFFEKMPEEKPPVVDRAHVFGLSIGLVLAFIAINLGVRAYLNQYTPNLGLWLIGQKWDLLLDLEESKDVLMLGDSTANQGLVPEVVVEQTGLSAVNLATVANMTFMNDVWMLKQYLNEHEPPKAVLIMNSYQMWHRMANQQSINSIPFSRVRDRAGVFQPDPDVSYTDHLYQRLLYYTPTYSASTSLRILIRTVIQIPPDLSLLAKQDYELSSLGTYSVLETDPVELAADINEHLTFLQIRHPELSAESAAGLAELKRMAPSLNFEIYLINAPLADEIAMAPGFAEYFSFVDNYLSDFFAETPNVHYLSEVTGYPRDQMESADHLLHAAAIDFTEKIAEMLLER